MKLAWARELDVSALDDTALQQVEQFYNLYVDKGGKECQPRCLALSWGRSLRG